MSIVVAALLVGSSVHAQDGGIPASALEFWSPDGKACAVSDPATQKTTVYAVWGSHLRSPIWTADGFFERVIVGTYGSLAVADTADCLLVPRADGAPHFLRILTGAVTRTIDVEAWVPNARQLSSDERERACGMLDGLEPDDVLRIGFDFRTPPKDPLVFQRWLKDVEVHGYFGRLVRIEMGTGRPAKQPESIRVSTGLAAPQPESIRVPPFKSKESCLVRWAPEVGEDGP